MSQMTYMQLARMLHKRGFRFDEWEMDATVGKMANEMEERWQEVFKIFFHEYWEYERDRCDRLCKASMYGHHGGWSYIAYIRHRSYRGTLTTTGGLKPKYGYHPDFDFEPSPTTSNPGCRCSTLFLPPA